MSNHPAPPRPKKPGEVTPRDARLYPGYYLAVDGPGRRAAQASKCEHDYYITDSCPCCP